jgi:hypothetical protein
VETLITERIMLYGKLQKLGGGDMIHASAILPPGPKNRDMTFVKVQVFCQTGTASFANRIFVQWTRTVDVNARQRNITPVYREEASYGRVDYFIHVRLPKSDTLRRTSRQRHHLLAAITPCILVAEDDLENPYYENLLTAPAIVDVEHIECVVGRIWDRGRWAIVQQREASRKVRLSDPSDNEVIDDETLGGSDERLTV